MGLDVDVHPRQNRATSGRTEWTRFLQLVSIACPRENLLTWREGARLETRDTTLYWELYLCCRLVASCTKSVRGERAFSYSVSVRTAGRASARTFCSSRALQVAFRNFRGARIFTEARVHVRKPWILGRVFRPFHSEYFIRFHIHVHSPVESLRWISYSLAKTWKVSADWYQYRYSAVNIFVRSSHFRNFCTLQKRHWSFNSTLMISHRLFGNKLAHWYRCLAILGHCLRGKLKY